MFPFYYSCVLVVGLIGNKPFLLTALKWFFLLSPASWGFATGHDIKGAIEMPAIERYEVKACRPHGGNKKKG